MAKISKNNAQRRCAVRRASWNRYLLVPVVTSGLALAGPAWAQSQAGNDGRNDSAVSLEDEGRQSYVLEPIAVEGEALTTVATKIPSTPREVPQSVSVITPERIEQQNLETLEDALKKSAGVTVERIDSNRVNFYSRGFQIENLLIDGVPTFIDDRVFLSPDLDMFERVEVLKGPAGLLSGAGGAGGAVNLVRKRPHEDPAASVKLGAGSWDNYRTEVDATGALNESGSLRGRVVAAHQDREFFIDEAWEDNALLYGIVEYDLTASTLLTFGASYQNVDTQAPRSLPAYSDYMLLDVPRSTFLGADWNRDEFVSTSAFVELEQALGREWLGKLALRHGYSTLDTEQAFAWGAVDRGDNTTGLWGVKLDYQQRQTGLDAYTTGPFDLFGRKHLLLLGANMEYIDFLDRDYSADPFQITDSLDVFNPRTDFDKSDFIFGGKTTTTSQQAGVYANTRLSVSDPLTLVLGGRVSWWDNEVEEDGERQERDRFDARFTPLAGLIYDVTDNYSLYASYAEIFRPQTERDSKGELVKPLVGEQYEAGIKGELFDGALNASLAVFRITEKNRAQEDPNAGPGDDFFVAQGEVQNEGFEAEVNGQVQPGWDVYAGYTYTKTADPRGNGYDGSAFSAIAPKHMFRLWTNYRLSADRNRWSVGAGVNAVSKFYNEFDNGERLTQPGYATVDARVGYDISRRASLGLNVTNLLDKKYYERVGNPNDGNIYGEPRAFMLTLRAEM